MSTMILTAKVCANCKYKFNVGQEIQCRFMPPSVQPIVAHSPQGPKIIGHDTSFPIVMMDWNCGQHAPGLALNAEEMKFTEGART